MKYTGMEALVIVINERIRREELSDEVKVLAALARRRYLRLNDKYLTKNNLFKKD